MEGPELVIIRGLFGEERIRYAEKEYPRHMLFEDDDFFLMEDGSCNPKNNLEKRAAEWCQHQVYYYLMRGHNVAVSNDFARLESILPYLLIANELEATLAMVECEGRNEDIMDRVLRGWEDIDKLKLFWDRYEHVPAQIEQPTDDLVARFMEQRDTKSN